MSSQKNISTTKVTKEQSSKPTGPVFGRINYILVGVSLLVVIIGFMMMTGKTDIYSTTKVSIAPITVIIGFCIGIAAIFYRKEEKSE
jgi:peptidoglycan/LPS O-acetylase OafA/YrhL